MKEKVVSKITFRCPRVLRSYEWVVMLFSLKNANATYQRAIHKIFGNLIGELIKVYINDVIIKFQVEEDHSKHLK